MTTFGVCASVVGPLRTMKAMTTIANAISRCANRFLATLHAPLSRNRRVGLVRTLRIACSSFLQNVANAKSRQTSFLLARRSGDHR
jgi:hypothetical protein